MKSVLLIATIMSKLIYGYNDKYCIDFGMGPSGNGDWMTGLNGEWFFHEMKNSKPSYKRQTLTQTVQNIRIAGVNWNEVILHFVDTNGWGMNWQFLVGTSNPMCDDGKSPEKPEQCTNWWSRQPVSIRSCGNEIATNPPTVSPTLPLPKYMTTEYNSIKPDEYNLINPYPECYYGKDTQTHFCNEIYSQNGNKANLAHPNYEERLTATLINMARLFPNEYRSSARYGGNKFNYYTGQIECGRANPVPLYYSQKANEAARFHNYDQLECKQPTVYGPEYNGMIHAHLTCNNPDRCNLFSGYTSISNEKECNAGSRWAGFMAMKPENGAHLTNGEGICFGNACYEDGHCGAMFKSDSEWIGIGKWKGSNSYDILYGAWTQTTKTPKKYPIVYGTHLDERYYFGDSQQTSTNKLTFLLEWYGVKFNNIRANSVHLLFENDEYTMTQLFGDNLSGFYHIDITMNSNDNKHFCEPYAFIVEASDGKKYRLPENDRYFFGTALFASYNKQPLYECNENHYYKNNNNQWIPNGGSLNLITSNDGCIGCSKADKLQLLN